MLRSLPRLRPLVFLAAFASGGLATLGLVEEAGAVAAPFSYVYLDAVEFPSGGVITGSVGCSGYACTASGPYFADSMGMAVPGTFLVGGTGGTFVFLPDAPLPEGSYLAQAGGSFGGTSATFTIVEATDELPEVSGSLQVGTIGTGELIGCVEATPGVTFPEFFSRTLAQPTLAVRVSGATSTQYRYNLVLQGETPTPNEQSSMFITLDEWGDEICYELYGFTYVDEEMVLIGAECLSTTELVLGESAEPFGNVNATLAYCIVPPEGFDDQWCAYFENAITDQSCDTFVLESCFAARRACPGGDNPSFEEEDDAINERDQNLIIDDGTTGDTGGTTTSSGTTSGTTGDTEGSTTSGTTADDTTGSSTSGEAGGGNAGDKGGCAVRGPQRGLNHWALVGLGWMLAWGHRLRRARRAA